MPRLATRLNSKTTTAAPRIADSTGMPPRDNSGARTTCSTSTISQAPTSPATIAPIKPLADEARERADQEQDE